MSFHKNLTTGDIHVWADQIYADNTARDADTTWNGDTSNVGKVVKVSSPLTYFVLEDTTPTWFDLGATGVDTIFTTLGTVSGELEPQRGVILEDDGALDFFVYDATTTNWTAEGRAQITPLGVELGAVQGDGAGGSIYTYSEVKVTSSGIETIVDGRSGTNLPYKIEGRNSALVNMNIYDSETGDWFSQVMLEVDANQNLEFGRKLGTSGVENSKQTLFIDDSTVTLTDTTNSRGLQYAADYSTDGPAVYGDRWIPDKGYVDSQTIYATDGTVTGDRRVQADNNDSLNFFSQDNNDSTFTRRCEVYLDAGFNVAELLWQRGDGAGSTTTQRAFRASSSQLLVIDTDGQVGAEYAADYSSNYTNRSLVDKEYADGLLTGATDIVQSPTSGGSLLATLTDAVNLDRAIWVGAKNNYVFAAMNFSGTNLVAIDVSDPTAPVLDGSVVTTTPQKCDLVGNYIYIVNSSDRFAIVDITDPANMVEVSNILDSTNLNGATDVNKQGDYAFVICGAGGETRITALNVTDPANPFVVSSLSDATNLPAPYALEVNGNYAYVGNLTGDRITIVDISEPSSLSVTGTVTSTLLTQVRHMLVDGSVLYVVGTSDTAIVSFDITDPATPTLISSVADGTDLSGAQSLTKNGGYLAVSTNSGITFVDVRDPAAMSVVYRLADAAVNITHMDQWGKYIYTVSFANDEFRIYQAPTVDFATAQLGQASASEMKVGRNLLVGRSAYVDDMVQASQVTSKTVSASESSTLIGEVNVGRIPFSGLSTNTAALGDALIYAHTGTGVIDLQISDASKTPGRLFIVKDEGGNAGANNFIVSFESGNIDGAVANITISADYGVARFYTDGTDCFSI